MKNRKVYQIVRGIKGKRNTQNELNVQVLNNWDASTLDAAFQLCRVAKESFGGEWWVMLETSKTVTVWVDAKTYEGYKVWQNQETRKARNTAKVK